MCAGRKPLGGIKMAKWKNINSEDKIVLINTGWLSRLRCVSGGEVEEVRIDVT